MPYPALLYTLIKGRREQNTRYYGQIYKSTGGYTCILGTKPDDTFNISSGVRQGAVESPPLFNILMDMVIRTAIGELENEDDFGIKI